MTASCSSSGLGLLLMKVLVRILQNLLGTIQKFMSIKNIAPVFLKLEALVNKVQDDAERKRMIQSPFHVC